MFYYFLAYPVDPADVGADPSEDRGLLGVVATHAWAEAHHTMDIPGTIRVTTVQGTTRVSLKGGRQTNERVSQGFTGSFTVGKIKRIRLTLQLASFPSPPAQTMLLVTRLPHQSPLVQVAWSTTGRRACCRMSAIGPPAVQEGQSIQTCSQILYD